MVTDQQVMRLGKFHRKTGKVGVSAAKAGMSETTARKYLRSGVLPSESLSGVRDWRTRTDPFEDVWDEVSGLLAVNPGLQGVTIFAHLQREYPGRFQDGQLRTLQRRMKVWRATEGPGREVFFPQRYEPGQLGESDFTDMSKLGVTIGGRRFDHLLYHFVLPYSNWETGTICFSESFESLSEGLQNALWELGGVPGGHRTDRLSTAVQKVGHRDEFTRRYQALLDHYGFEGRAIQAGEPQENGDVEQSHYRIKQAVDQALMLRGSRDFDDRASYATFLRGVMRQRNAGRRRRFEEELRALRPLPGRRLETRRRLSVRVGQGSTIRVAKNVYSVHSRLIGERVEVRLGAEDLEIWYGQRKVEQLPRLRGEGRHRINYRHVIDWLVRKPGAFGHYLYRDGLYPTTVFRVAYDMLKETLGERASREYVSILYLAAREGEARVEAVLCGLMAEDRPVSGRAVEKLLAAGSAVPEVGDVMIDAVDLESYDELLSPEGEGCATALS
jgi:transposase